MPITETYGGKHTVVSVDDFSLHTSLPDISPESLLALASSTQELINANRAAFDQHAMELQLFGTSTMVFNPDGTVSVAPHDWFQHPRKPTP